MRPDMGAAPVFDEDFRARLEELIVWRRDVRRFRTDPLPAGAVERLLGLACLAPSVGLSEPWRFVLVESDDKRRLVAANFEDANAEALSSYSGERASLYASLKLEGIREAPVQLAAFAEPDPEKGRTVGRRTMPETVAYSVVAAMHTMWLAARAEGIGMGWVSILDPVRVARDLDVPPHWQFIGYFCIGYPLEEASSPELERVDWERRTDPATVVVRR
ncbi:5,6-dimethylbenzimidazole synthase [Rhodomicrobium sp. Az07]|uniref:5,6-dimethylbenzimidazole synthase n=1 Tax=Rhodomicrobium sp. Az07 TaxID=2839034 RepID=UPI002036A17E|nr:5,6-dimethylbenzimidazole synthase [Rhodomicrobium sp. Az07]